MDYSKYYTPPAIAKALINELDLLDPVKVVDICCGSCNLLLASRDRWVNIIIHGTDIVGRPFDENVVFEKIDGRNYSLKHAREFPLVVANPPFGRVECKKQIPGLFNDEFKEINTSRLEIEMLIANLNLLEVKGVLLIIMPSSFVEGEKCRSIRKIIAKNYCIDSIFKLDESTFGTSKINSYALVIRKDKQRQCGAKMGYSDGDRIIYSSYMDCDNIMNGNWSMEMNKVSSLFLEIKRGNISSSSFVSIGIPVLHTSKRSNDWQPVKRYISKNEQPTTFAEAGDIIVSRIGKSAGQWCKYDGKKIAISDCLFRIKDPDSTIFNIIKGKTYNRSLRGVATRYITMDDLRLWIASVSGK